MKKVQLLLFVALISLSVSAQSDKYTVGTNVISGGFGLGSSIAGYTYGSEGIGLNLQYERGLWEAGPGVISLGGYLGTKSYTYNYYAGSAYSAKWNYTILGVRGVYHYTGLNIPNLDLYGGLMISYDALSFSDNQGTSYSGGGYGSTTELSVFAGGRYYFSPHFAGYAELGVGVSILSLGIAVKF